MSLVPAKCTNCGGELQIDNTKDAAVCPYCGSAFIIEKAVNLYNQTYNINTNTVNILQQSGGRDSADKLYEAGLNALNIHNYSLAEKCFSDMKKYYPSDYRGYWGMMKYYSQGYSMSETTIKEVLEEFKNACALANPDEKKIIVNNYNTIVSKFNKELSEYAEESARIRNKKIREQTIDAEKKLKQIKKEMRQYAIVAFSLCLPLIISIILDFNIIIKIISGLFVFGAISSVGIIISEILPKLNEAEKHYQKCKKGNYQWELENL